MLTIKEQIENIKSNLGLCSAFNLSVTDISNLMILNMSNQQELNVYKNSYLLYKLNNQTDTYIHLIPLNTGNRKISWRLYCGIPTSTRLHLTDTKYYPNYSVLLDPPYIYPNIERYNEILEGIRQQIVRTINENIFLSFNTRFKKIPI